MKPSKAEEQAKAKAKVADLFADHHDRLEAYLRKRLANQNDAAELAQEAYLRILRVKRADLIRHPEAYLYRVARNLVHELYAGHRPNSFADVDVDQLTSGDPSPFDQALLARRRELVQRAMEELSPKCQAALLLRWHEDLTQAEIAERINVSRQMVQKYLASGIAHCRKRLRRIAEQERDGSHE